jgi:hypothetical protein
MLNVFSVANSAIVTAWSLFVVLHLHLMTR